MRIQQYKLTLISGLLGVASGFVARLWDYDVWEVVGGALSTFDKVAGHEALFAVFFMAIGFILDLNARRKRSRLSRKLSEERLRAMKTTMTTVQDIVNNALNALQIFRLEVEVNASLPQASIRQFDAIIFDTTKRLQAIEDTDVYIPRKIAAGFSGLQEPYHHGVGPLA